MSEVRPCALARPSALSHVGEVAQWTLMLLGWLWLGEQGMRLGWSLASGVLAVALWWAARLVCRGSAWAWRARPLAMLGGGLLCALGVWLPEGLAGMAAMGVSHAGAGGPSAAALPLSLPHAALLGVALMWGAFSGAVETRSQTSTFWLGAVAWHPVLAAALVALAWHGPAQGRSATGAVSVLWALCALGLFARERSAAKALPICRGPRSGWGHLLAPSAMGLMMGSLWQGNAWCLGLGWSAEQMVLSHLAMMAVLPTVVALLLRRGPLGATGPSTRACADASAVLLALGAGLLWGQSAVQGLLAMLLPSLAWALHCSRPRTPVTPTAHKALSAAPRGLSLPLALGLGPGLLLWVGLASPLHGPLALQVAMALLGALAAWQVARRWWRKPALPTWSTP